jgi:hypothetical protein
MSDTEIDIFEERRSLARRLMELFFQAPAASALLVFEDNDYLGVVLKRDIEIGISEGNFSLSENLNFVKQKDLPAVIFRENGNGVKIPVIDREGELIRIISHEEYVCQFQFESYIPHFSEQAVLDSLEHPVVITSHFKKVVYANKKAMELFNMDLVGRNIAPVLKDFHMNVVKDSMILEQNGALYRLTISHSLTRNFSYLFYQFFRA